MNRPNRVRSSHEGYERMKIHQERRAKTIIEAEISPCLFKNHSDNSRTIGEIEKSLEKKTFFDNECFKIVKAMSLALSILIMCYYGLTEYNVLQNGQVFRGLPTRKTIVSFSFGYSVSHSIISALAASLLVYSIIMKQPKFSLPFIGFFLTELVCDFCDMVIMIWYLFKHLQIQTALLYAASLLLMILAEIWTWLGVVWLYEHRNFKAH
ncbi:uncharacterized protein LOC105829173 [Monomorium pharaonis]|uniref:uncharacterized protein LOC105829173 n=1 Tax=Monomorium pharaonis TaxID=307658 RepID=UPI00063FA3F5|nr:uncharacterized protein LOC105829173 [Monomorium pharaonis]XP_036151309.1 uncharacterized protein LOC105829173 [Monomorium pharaonis]